MEDQKIMLNTFSGKRYKYPKVQTTSPFCDLATRRLKFGPENVPSII